MVHDPLKSVFGMTATHSRAELVDHLFLEHYLANGRSWTTSPACPVGGTVP